MLEIKIIFTLLFQRFDLSLVPGQYIAANAITRLPKNGIRFRLRKRTTTPSTQMMMENNNTAASTSTSVDQHADDPSSIRQRNVAVLKPLGMI